jgi:hypothetical protein
MNAICITIVIFAWTTFAVGAERTYFSHLPGKVYEFKVTETIIAKTPAWPEEAEHPPLSSRHGLRLAKATLGGMVADAAEWELESLAIEPWGDRTHWIYVITFRHFTTTLPDSNGVRSVSVGRPATITIPILLSGVAVEPTVTKSKAP